MASFVTPKKNTEFIFYMSLTSQANGNVFQVNPTLAAGDVKVSTDGGAEANITTLPAVTPAGSKRVKVTLSATEMNGDNVQVTFSDAAGAEWADVTINIQTSLQQIDDVATQASVNTIDDFLDTEVAAILAAVDTEVGAIKTKTDNLPAAVKKNTALANFMFKMVLTSDHVSVGTGLAVTATRSLDGAAFAACANAVTEISAGWYKISLAATDLNADTVALKFTAATADQRDIMIVTQT